MTHEDPAKNSSSSAATAAVAAGDFLYQQLIEVPPLSGHECCHGVNMGHITTLSLICIFNLAVVHHLRAPEGFHRQPTRLPSKTNPPNDLEKALKLYDVAHKYLEKHIYLNRSRNSVEFRLVLSNNLSHIHNVLGHKFEHEHYLREVLSTTMSLIDSQRNWSNTDDDSSSSLQANTNRQKNKCIDLEGFLANAAPLFSKSVCADAA